MPSATTQSRTGNPAALARALYYVGHFGSAAAALEAVECPGHDDAFDRQVNEELRGLRYADAVAVRAGASLALAQSAVAERIADNPRTVDWFGAACALTDARVRDLSEGAAA